MTSEIGQPENNSPMCLWLVEAQGDSPRIEVVSAADPQGALASWLHRHGPEMTLDAASDGTMPGESYRQIVVVYRLLPSDGAGLLSKGAPQPFVFNLRRAEP